MHLTHRAKAIMTLSLLSPVFGELVSGSTPPIEFINPISFLLLWGLYGGGVLLMRELWVKWGKGYTRLMMLGMTYGIIEEGLAIKSFFDPNWMDLGIFATYGRFMGVNFAWAFWLMAFHAIYSITVPILIFSALYPEFSDRSLLSDGELRKVLGIFLLVCIIIFFGLNPYAPPPIQYALTFIIVMFILKRLRKGAPRRLMVVSGFPRRPVMWSALFSTAIFLNFVILPQTGLPAAVMCLTGILLLISLYSSMDMKGPKEYMAVTMGLMIPILLFYDIVLEIHGVLGMSAVGIITFLAIFSKYRRLSDAGIPKKKDLMRM